MSWTATRWYGSPLKLMVTAALSMVVLLGATIAFRAFRREAGSLHAVKSAIARPADAGELGLRDVAMTTSRGTTVHGWLLPSHNGASIVYVHGSPSDRTGLLPEARALARAGYGALLLDIPGHGESGGERRWDADARSAVSEAVGVLLSQEGVRSVGAHGFSMGTSIVASVAAVDTRIHAVVLSGVFTNIRDQLAVEFGRWGALSRVPARWAAISEGLALDELVPASQVAALSPRPLLLIAGANDLTVPPAMTRAVFDAAREPKQLLLVPHAGHGDYAAVMGEPYFQALQHFFDRALLSKQTAAR